MKRALINFAVMLALWLGAWLYFHEGPPQPMATCKDGSISRSRVRSGTCSRHGGVLKWSKESK